MDLDQLHTFLEIVRLKSFSKGRRDLLSDAAGHQRAGPPVGAGAEHELVRPAGNAHRADTGGPNPRRICRADSGSAAAGPGRHQRTGARPSRRSDDRRQRSHLHVRSAAGVLRLHQAVSQRATPGGPGRTAPRWCRPSWKTRRTSVSRSCPSSERKLQVVKVHSDEIQLIVPPGHPLASQDSVTCQDMVGHPLLMPKPATRARG